MLLIRRKPQSSLPSSSFLKSRKQIEASRILLSSSTSRIFSPTRKFSISSIENEKKEEEETEVEIQKVSDMKTLLSTMCEYQRMVHAREDHIKVLDFLASKSRSLPDPAIASLYFAGILTGTETFDPSRNGIVNITATELATALTWFYVSIARIAQDILCCDDPSVRNASSAAFHMPQRAMFIFDKPARLGFLSKSFINATKQQAVAILKDSNDKLPSPIHVAFATTFGMQPFEDIDNRAKKTQQQQQQTNQQIEIELSKEEIEKIKQVKLKPRSEWPIWRALALDAFAATDERHYFPEDNDPTQTTTTTTNKKKKQQKSLEEKQDEKEAKALNFIAPLTKMRNFINVAPHQINEINRFKPKILDL